MDLYGDIILTTLGAMMILTGVIFAHELGHFFVARILRIRVASVSFFIGPELFGCNDRHGTRWTIGSILGAGYVRFGKLAAPELESSIVSDVTSFSDCHVAKRAAVLIAGPLASLLLVIGLFSAVGIISGRPIAVPRIASVEPGAAADIAGMRPGDVILSVDGHQLDSFVDLQRIVAASGGRRLTITVDRSGARIALSVEPTLVGENRRPVLGVTRSNGPGDVFIKSVSLAEGIELGIERTWFEIQVQYSQIVNFNDSADQIGGPIGIARMSGLFDPSGGVELLTSAGKVSLALCLLNLLPLPIGDGGNLVYCGIEVLRNRPVSDKARGIGFRVALVCGGIIGLCGVLNDIWHLRAS